MMTGNLILVLMVLSCSLCLRTRHRSVHYSLGDCFVLTSFSVDPLSSLLCENSMEQLCAVLEEYFSPSTSMECRTVRRTLSVYLKSHNEKIRQRLSDETLCGKPATEILIVFSCKTKSILSCACTQQSWVYVASANIVYNSRAFQLVNDKCSHCCTTFTGYVEDPCIAMKIQMEAEVSEDDKLCNEDMLSNPWWTTFAVNVVPAIHLHFQYGHCGQVVHCISVRNWIIVSNWCHNIVMEQNLVIVRVSKDSMGQPLGERGYAAVGQVNQICDAVGGNVTVGQFRNVWNVLQDCIIVDLFRNIWKRLQGNSSIGQSETTQDWLQRLTTTENVYMNLFAISQGHFVAVTVNTLQECLSAFVQFINIAWTCLQDLITSASQHTHCLMYTLQGCSVAASQAFLIIFREDFASIYQYRNHSESGQRGCSYLAGTKSNNVVHHALYSWLYTCLIHIFVLASWLFYLSNQSEQERQRICRVGSVTLVTKWHVVQIGMDLEPSQKFRKKWHRPSKKINTKHNSHQRQPCWDSVLNDYIFHPWRTASLPPVRHRGESAKAASSCSSSHSSLCCSCQQYVDMNLPTMGRGRVMEVWPVTRFLPDATRNPSVDLSHVGYRLATLSILPSSLPVSRIRLADAGFYSRGQGDEVMCFCCQARHSGWTAQDSPIEVHRRLSPQCPHVQQRDREVAVLAGGGGSAGAGAGTGLWHGQTSADDEEDGQGSHEEQDSRPQSLATADSEVGPAPSPDLRTTSQTGNPTTVTAEPDVRRSEGMRTTNNETGTSQNSRTNNNARNPEDARTSNGTSSTAQSRSVFPRAGLDLGGAVYPMYQDMASRRRSFTNWDDSRAPPLDQVLLCGMFYAGYADCVRCFYCGVGLKHWVITDDVWIEHVRWRPECGYLRAVKGDDFIRNTWTRLQSEAQTSRTASQDVPRANSTSQPAASYAITTASVTTSATPAVTAPTAETRRVFSSSSLATAGTSSVPVGGGRVTATSTPSPSSSSSTGNNQTGVGRREGGSGSETRGSRLIAVSSDVDERERLSALQAENRSLNQRFQCQVCRQASIDTILMPCGHLVLCHACAATVTSCPLCSDPVESTARVHLA